MPQDWNYGTDHMGIASRALGRLREGLECYGLLTTSSAWESTNSCDGLLCSFDIHVGLESLQGTLIEPDQTTAGSIQISDQRNDQRDSDGEKN